MEVWKDSFFILSKNQFLEVFGNVTKWKILRSKSIQKSNKKQESFFQRKVSSMKANILNGRSADGDTEEEKDKFSVNFIYIWDKMEVSAAQM